MLPILKEPVLFKLLLLNDIVSLELVIESFEIET